MQMGGYRLPQCVRGHEKGSKKGARGMDSDVSDLDAVLLTRAPKR